jgi:hypothetical protein
MFHMTPALFRGWLRNQPVYLGLAARSAYESLLEEQLTRTKPLHTPPFFHPQMLISHLSLFSSLSARARFLDSFGFQKA